MREKDRASPWYEVIFKDYFGVNWTGFTALSGILLSGFGLAGYLNPAVWTFGALVGLMFGYSIRSYITDRYMLLVVLTALFWAVVGFIALYPWLENSKQESVSLVDKFWVPGGYEAGFATLMIALAISLSIAILIVSYKKLYVLSPVEIPENFRSHIKTIFEGGTVFRRGMRYDLKFSPQPEPEDGVVLNVRIAYELVNMGKVKLPEDVTYRGAPGRYDIVKFCVGDEDYAGDVKNQEGGEDVKIRKDVYPNQPLKVELETIERYPAEGNDFFTTHLPCDGFTVAFDTTQEITVWGHDMSPEKFVRDTEGETRLWKREGALLPFHGVRLFWRKEKADATGKAQ